MPARTVPITRSWLDVQLHSIGGEFRASASGETLESLNPSTNHVLALACAGAAPEVDAAVAEAREAFDESPLPRANAEERAKLLRAIAAAIPTHADEFVALEVADIGMPVSQMRGLAARAAQNFDYSRGCCLSCTDGRSSG